MDKIKCYSLSGLCLAALAALTGCVDKSYDLDNYDNTARVLIKDLTLPVEFTGGVKFSDVVDIEDNDLVKTDAQGNYVLIQSGDFESEAIRINEIEATPNVENFESQVVPIVGIAGQPIDFNVEQYARFDFEFSFDLVDGYIRDITRASVDFNINFKVETGIPCKLTNLSFRLPTGMTGAVVGNYDMAPANGNLITFNSVSVPNGVFTFSYHVTDIDIKEAGGRFIFAGNGDYGVFELKNSISLVSGKLEATQSGNGSLKASFNIGTIKVNTIDGSVKYTIDDIVEHTSLDELPELLKDPHTHLGLVNPQLYLHVNNPFAQYGAEASTKITLNQLRPDNSGFLPQSQKSVTTANPVTVTDDEVQEFVLSDVKPAELYSEFPTAKWTRLQGLGNIVYGEGLPTELEFIFTDPMLDSDHVKNFPIGREVGTVHGKYAFYAPLDFSAGSQVVYTQDQQGWDLSDIVVNKFEITTNVTSTIPVGVILSAYPIVLDDDGNAKVDYNVPISATEIEASAVNQPVVIKMNGTEVRNLDGMRYTVTLKTDQPGAIGPDKELQLNDVRVTVSGYYDFSDDDKDDDDDNY